MTFHRLAFVLLALCLAGPLASCDDTLGLGGLVPDKSDYDFSTSCNNLGDLEACSSCCDTEGFDTALVATGDCGCAYVIDDSTVCDGSKATSEECFDCCETAGASGSNRSSLNGEATCSCFIISKTNP